jgi:subtilisin family serine protease
VHRPPLRRLLRSALALTLLLAIAATIAQLAGVSGGRHRPPTRLVFDGVHEQWLVQAPGVRSGSLEQAARSLGGGKSNGELPGGWHVVQTGDEVASADAEAAFASAGATLVEPFEPRRPYDEPTAAGDPVMPTTQRDPRSGPTTATRLGEEWALGQDSDQDIDGVEAWQTSTGAGTVVAVIDTGVDATHPDLVGRVLPGKDFSGSTTGATVDRIGHGTEVASVIAANGGTMAGVAPDAKILPLKVFKDSESLFSTAGYLSAIYYAADQGVDVFNISRGCGGQTSCYSQAELDALTYAVDKGVVITTAAGNGDYRTGLPLDNDDPKTPDYPSGYDLPGLVSVTSSDRLGEWSDWSNYGRSSVDLAAPGEGILVARAGGGYDVVDGTSFSAPMVAGAAALLASAHPGITPDDIRGRLVSSATAIPTMQGRAVSNGTLNANAALFALETANAGGTEATLVSPRPAAVVRTPPVLSWKLPAGWSSSRVLLRGPGGRFDHSVRAGARAYGHPVAAWRSGTYRWQVVARTAQGTLVTSRARSYRLAPRLGAWVTSGRVRGSGRDVRLRIGYASSEPAAMVRVIVSAGGHVVHNGRSTRRTMHTRGSGSPRRGWFSYDAHLSRTLRIGQRITVEVRVSAAGTALTRRFRATVA